MPTPVTSSKPAVAAKPRSRPNVSSSGPLSGPDDELKELGDTFDALLARLERSFAAQRQFVASASHELRSPLTLERALLEAALTDPRPTGPMWRSTCERVLAAGEQQERLIGALLDLATGEAGLTRRWPLDLAGIAGQAVAASRPAAEAGDLELSTALGPAAVAGDPRLVERLAANLVGNAIRHNEPGGRVEVVTGISDGAAVLCVRNTGPVVREAEMAEIFLPFRRLGAERTGHDGGAGLGLAIVRAIATAHDAAVAARPRPGGGLEITVRFPAPDG